WPQALAKAAGIRAAFERSDAEVRTLEGLAPRAGPLLGEIPAPVRFVEAGLSYEVDVAHGQKTGFFLDQRDNRALAATLAPGADVLNAFCYTGGFSIGALAAGARSALSIDTSEEALTLARRNAALNG